MGCIPSKEPASAAAAGGNKTNPPSKTPSNLPAAASRVVNDTLQHFQRMSVVDQVMLAKQLVTTTTQNKARQLKNVFAAPLMHDDDFVPPVYPKSKTQKSFIEKAILQNFVFSNLRPAEISTMIDAFEKISFDKDTAIIEQGQDGDYFYVIESGTVQFVINKKPVGGKPAGEGDTFGELALLYSAPRAATCVAQTPVVAYRVDQTTFRAILQTQTQTANDVKLTLLKKVSFLQELEPSDLAKLVGTLTPRPFTKGQVLVKKGDDGDAFYVIQSGKVSVTNIEVGGQTYEDMELGPGDFFGERALLTKEPRTANCIAATDGIAQTVDRDTFTKVMGNLSTLVLKASDRHKLVRSTTSSVFGCFDSVILFLILFFTSHVSLCTLPSLL